MGRIGPRYAELVEALGAGLSTRARPRSWRPRAIGARRVELPELLYGRRRGQPPRPGQRGDAGWIGGAELDLIGPRGSWSTPRADRWSTSTRSPRRSGTAAAGRRRPRRLRERAVCRRAYSRRLAACCCRRSVRRRSRRATAWRGPPPRTRSRCWRAGIRRAGSRAGRRAVSAFRAASAASEDDVPNRRGDPRSHSGGPWKWWRMCCSRICLLRLVFGVW